MTSGLIRLRHGAERFVDADLLGTSFEDGVASRAANCRGDLCFRCDPRHTQLSLLWSLATSWIQVPKGRLKGRQDRENQLSGIGIALDARVGDVDCFGSLGTGCGGHPGSLECLNDCRLPIA